MRRRAYTVKGKPWRSKPTALKHFRNLFPCWLSGWCDKTDFNTTIIQSERVSELAVKCSRSIQWFLCQFWMGVYWVVLLLSLMHQLWSVYVVPTSKARRRLFWWRSWSVPSVVYNVFFVDNNSAVVNFVAVQSTLLYVRRGFLVFKINSCLERT